MRERGKFIEGKTYKINTGYGTLYITLNDDEDGPFETFLRIGKSGGFVSSMTEAVGRLTSLCLRNGIPPEDIIRQLRGIRGPRIGFVLGRESFSIPDAFSKVISQHIGKPEVDLNEDVPA